MAKRKKIKRSKNGRKTRPRRVTHRVIKQAGNVDKIFLWLVLVLVFIGLVSISSAGIVVSQAKFGDPYHYFKHQLFYGAMPGLIAMFIVSKVNYNLWRKLAAPFFISAVITLVLVLVSSHGLELKGAKRWVMLGPVSFQPTEMVKLAVIVYLASLLAKKGRQIKDFSDSLVPFTVAMGIVGGLILLQPDVGTLGAIMFIALAMFFLAGASLKHIASLIAIGIGLLVVMIKLEPYRMNRFLAFMDSSIDPQGIGWQVKQAAIAVGNGGIFGVGLGHSHQKFSYLPEVVGDSIFAIIAEEIGMVGAGVIVILFVMLALRGFRLAKKAPDRFSSFLILGVSLWIIFQAFINIMAIIGLMPLTGITLPFISYGSTSLIFILVGVGIVLNISRFDKSR
jgi:cell division protein FtsW